MMRRLLWLLPLLAATAIAPDVASGPVWFTDGTTVTQFHSETALVRTQADAMPLRAIAPVPDGGAWVWRGKQVIRLAPNLAASNPITVDPLAGDGPVSLASDPVSDGVWLAGGDLVRFHAAGGELITQWRHDEPIHDLAVGGPLAIWVASAGGITQYDSTGAATRHLHLDPPQGAHANRRIALDRAGGYVWAVAANEAVQVDVLAGMSVHARWTLPETFVAAGVDAASGALWVLSDAGIRTIDREGRASHVTSLTNEFHGPLSIAPDVSIPLTWAGDAAGLYALNQQTLQWLRVTAGAPAALVTTPALRMRPTVTLAADGSPAAIRLAYGAECGSMPCMPTARYVGSLQLRAVIDSVDVSHYFVQDGNEGAATLAALPPGMADASTLVATVTDAYGVDSQDVQVDLVADVKQRIRPRTNALPTVSITAPANNATFVAPAAITINATAADSDGTITKVDFLHDGVLLGTDSTAPYSYSWANVPAGTYKLTAKAYDNVGATTTSAVVTIQVKANVAPIVSITAPANNSSYTAPATISITANATDADGKIAGVDFYQGATKLASVAAPPYTYAWNGVAGGTYSLTARATDDRGAVTTSAAVTVKVNKPPTVSITAPANGAVYVAPASFAIQASATDADGSISKVEFFRDGTLLATDTTSPYSYAWNNVAVGTYVLTARATDNLGAATTSTAVTVAVGANKPPSVAITAPANGTFVAGVPIVLAATASDSDGSISKVDFRASDGSTSWLLGTVKTAPYSLSYAPGVGTITVTAVATDNLGAATISAPITMTVVANQDPVVDLTTPVQNQIFVSATPPDIPLKATSSDADGSVVAVRFYMLPQPTVDEDVPTLLATVSVPPYQAVWKGAPHTGVVVAGREIDSYLVWAEATDNGGATWTSEAPGIQVLASTPRTVRLSAPYDSPDAFAVVYHAPATIVLRASASQFLGSDPIAKVEFFADGVLVGSAATATGPDGEYVAIWRSVSVGTRQLVARLTESNGSTVDSEPIVISVVVPNQAPTVAVTAPANGQFFYTYGGFSDIPVSATAADPDGTVKEVDLLDNGRIVALGNAAQYTGTSTSAASGLHVISARAIDDRGAVAQSKPVFTYVPMARRAPLAVITNPVANSTVTSSATVTVTADIVAPDGGVGLVEFYDGAVKLAQKTSSPWTLARTFAEGVHSLRVVASLTLGAHTWSAPVALNVVAGGSGVVPTVSLATPGDDQVFLAPATVQLSVTTNDPQSRLSSVDYLAGTQTVATVSAPPFAANWTNVSQGNYEIMAVGRFDANAKSTASGMRTISVRPNEFVELVAPGTGASFGPGEPIELSARSGLRKGVARIDFLADATLLGSVAVSGAPTVATVRFTWKGAPVGSHAVEARAFAADGTSSTMWPVVIAVANLAVDIVEPYAGQVYYAPSDIRIMANPATGSGAVAQVDFYGDGVLLGSRTAAPYILLWTGVAAGNHSVSVRVRDAAGTYASAAPVSVSVVAGGGLQVDPGIDGSSVADGTLSFGGTVQAPPNSAVIVNGRLAPHDRDGRFFVNNVALTPGANTVTLMLNSQDAAPITKTISVTSTGVAPFEVDLDDSEGIAPFVTNLTITNRGNVGFARIDVDMQDDGAPDVTLTSLLDGEARVALNYSSPGIYTVRVTVSDAGGIPIYTASRKLLVRNASHIALRATGVYLGMLDALRAGRITAATNAISASMQDKYNRIFVALGSRLSSAVDKLGTIQSITIGQKIGEVMLRRDTVNGPQAFPILLLRSEDGLWRIDGM